MRKLLSLLNLFMLAKQELSYLWYHCMEILIDPNILVKKMLRYKTGCSACGVCTYFLKTAVNNFF